MSKQCLLVRFIVVNKNEVLIKYNSLKITKTISFTKQNFKNFAGKNHR